ncbi:MAG: glycosyltransferase [Deltaproteobacteria bacterium]|nr:glycosyltransferase [Deltaproteobacteria bacterium]
MTKTLDRPPAVSVVMSVYNGGQFLPLAIQSILDQTFKNFEFIIVDDGSTDNSAEIIKSFNDPRIKLLTQKNKGLVNSLNRAVKISRGEFIARMDDDDISLPQRLEKELIAITANQSIGVAGSYYSYIDTAGTPFASHISPTLHEDLRFLLLHKNPYGHGSTLIRKEALVKAGLYRDKYPAAEDYDLWRRIARDWLLVQIPEGLYLYRQNPEGISSKKSTVQQKSTTRIINELWKEVIPAVTALNIKKHYKFYKKLDTSFANKIADKYLDDLVRISLAALAKNKPRTFIKTTGGLVLSSPIHLCKLLYLVGRSLIRKILVKLGIYHK